MSCRSHCWHETATSAVCCFCGVVFEPTREEPKARELDLGTASAHGTHGPNASDWVAQ